MDEEEIERSPMERMKPPIVPEEPVEVLPLDQVRRLLTSCDGRGFADRRDTATVRLLLDTGMRLNELRALTVDDVDLDQDVAIVLGKGRRPRSLFLAAQVQSISSTEGWVVDRRERVVVQLVERS